MFENLLKAVVGVVTLPIDAAADAVNQVRYIAEPKTPPSHLKRKAAAIMDNLHDAIED